MKNFTEQKTQQKTAVNSTVLNESQIQPLDILQEIEPLIKEYFIGDFKIEGNSLKLEFKNGQHFKLFAVELN